MNTRKFLSIAIALSTIASVAAALPVSADTTSQPGGYAQGHPGGFGGGMGHGPAMRPGVVGTVASVSGTTLTVTGKQGFGSSTEAVTYTVDASNATVMKDNATSSVSAIDTGDTVFVQGTVSGTNVTATIIRDGVMMGRGQQGGTGKRGLPGEGSSTPPFEGNGEPLVAGSVTAVSGGSITLSNKSDVTYTVDATNAKIIENGVTSPTVSNIAVGDNVVVQGTVNGTSVVASTVIDQKAPNGQNGSTQGAPGKGGGFGGILGGIGSFFKHLFGF